MSSPEVGDIGTLEHLGTNVADLLRSAAQRYPERPAVISPAGVRTWGELDAAADAGVAALRTLGAQPGERVVITLPTGPNLALALFAVARAGLIAVPIGPSRADTGAIADRVGAIAGVSLQNDHGLPIAIGPAHLAQWWSMGPSDRPAAIGGGEDLVLLARARGDRAVMLSHRSVLAAVRAIALVGGLRLRDFDRALQVLPMYHVAGWVVGFLPLALVGGATVVPEIGFDPATAGAGGQHDDVGAAGRQAAESALAAARRHQVTVVPGAPGFYHHLLALDGAKQALSSARLLTSGMAPVDSDDFAAVRDLVGQPVWEGYGLSESASVVTSSLTGPEPAAHSVGRPVAGLELRIIGADGRDVNLPEGPEPAETEPETHDPLDFVAEVPDAGEVGRIVIRGATLFSGYWPEGVGGPDADGWFVTGDIGYLDDSGELHLVDRAAETLNVAGFTVYPREVEETLAERSDIAEVAVIGVPDGTGHDRVVAVLVAQPGGEPTLDELFEFAAERLPVFKRPADYHLVPALPRTEVGRLDRSAVLLSYENSPRPAERTGPKLSAVPAASDDHDNTAGDAGQSGRKGEERGTEPAPDEVDTAPEQAGELSELGVRLPWTGDRVDRGEQDTDDDMF